MADHFGLGFSSGSSSGSSNYPGYAPNGYINSAAASSTAAANVASSLANLKFEPVTNLSSGGAVQALESAGLIGVGSGNGSDVITSALNKGLKDFFTPINKDSLSHIEPGSSALDNLPDFLANGVSSVLPGNNNGVDTTIGSGSGSSSGVSINSAGTYFNAPYAEAYGMDATTAYMESLANSSHQREVADLQAAGLNPVLSAKYGGSAGVTTASSVDNSAVGASQSQSIADIIHGIAGVVTDVLRIGKIFKIFGR